MSGAEIFGTSEAAGKAVAKIVGISTEERATLAAIAESHPAMHKAADSYAKNLAVRSEVVRRLFLPVGWLMGIRKDWLEEEFPAEVAARIADVPDENLQTPRPGFLGPAIEGLAYNLDSSALRDMYLNLIAAGTDNRRDRDAHPAFTEILKQLAPEEAQHLVNGIRRGTHTCVQVHRVRGDGTWLVEKMHILNWVSDYPSDLEFSESGRVFRGGEELSMSQVKDMIYRSRMMPSGESSVWVENWKRLGLMDVTYDEEAVRDYGAYLAYQGHPEIEALKNAAVGTDEEIRVVRGVMSATAFGRQFFSAVTNGESSGAEVVDVRAPRGLFT